jgi:VWFA-related protein
MRNVLWSTVVCLSVVTSGAAVAQSEAGGAPQNPASAVAPQAAPQSPANTLRAYSTVVILDGVALDRKGNPVLDLKAEDFKVLEDNVPQEIRRFETPGHSMPPPNVDIESTADLDRYAPEAPVNIVLLDEFNTHFEDMAFARYSLKKWLDRQPGKLDEPTMLIAVSIDKFQVLRDYTQDKQKILDALDHHFAAYPWQAHNFGWVPERFSLAFTTLMRVAEASSGHLGHKDMIWLGRGFPNINLVGAGVDAERRINNAVQLTVNQLRDARVTLYTIDPAGLQVDPGTYGNDAALFAPFGGEPNFEALSRATGGRPLHGRNDVDAMIGSAIRDGDSLYSFSYRPTNTTYDPQKFRRIKVEVDRPGVTFITRQGYYPQTGPARPTQDGRLGRQLATELVSASTSNMAYDAVPFSVSVSHDDAHQWMVVVQPKGMAWYFGTADEPRRTRLLVTITTFDKKNKLLKTTGQRLEFKAPMTAPSRGRYESGVRFPYKLEPDPKAVRARMVVRVEASGHMGSADFPLVVGTTVSSDGEAPASPGEAAPAATPQTH